MSLRKNGKFLIIIGVPAPADFRLMDCSGAETETLAELNISEDNEKHRMANEGEKQWTKIKQHWKN